MRNNRQLKTGDGLGESLCSCSCTGYSGAGEDFSSLFQATLGTTRKISHIRRHPDDPKITVPALGLCTTRRCQFDSRRVKQYPLAVIWENDRVFASLLLPTVSDANIVLQNSARVVSKIVPDRFRFNSNQSPSSFEGERLFGFVFYPISAPTHYANDLCFGRVALQFVAQPMHVRSYDNAGIHLV